MTRRKVGLISILVVLILLGAGGFYWYSANGRTPSYRTASVERGELISTISSTGTLNAVVTVQVGTQVSGTIQQLLVDFNSPVKKGMLIARIDPSIFDAKANQAQADLESSRASVLNQRAAMARAQADLANARANVVRQEVALRDAKIKLDSRTRLFREGGISQEERDSSQAAYDSAVAQLDAAHAGVGAAQAALEVTQAQVTSAEAQVRQKQAALEQAQVDLRNTYIRAPVDGIVVSRNVDVGQTVAASLQAPTLFLIAQDLTKMQVDTNVDEADIGRVSLDQEATFTVDSYPSLTFRGRVVQIRQAPQVVQNVVTYNTVVAVANPESEAEAGHDGQREDPGRTPRERGPDRERRLPRAGGWDRLRWRRRAAAGCQDESARDDGAHDAAHDGRGTRRRRRRPPGRAEQPAAGVDPPGRQAGGAAGSDRVERRPEDRDPGRAVGRRRGDRGAGFRNAGRDRRDREPAAPALAGR